MTKRPELPDHVLVEKQIELPRNGKLPGMPSEYRVKYYCSVCDRQWDAPPSTKCPGAKVYQWQPWPPGLSTRKQLATKKLNPGPLAGVIPYDKSGDGDGWLRLYRETEAVPKPALSPKRQAALDKAKAAADQARHCTMCNAYLHTRDELYRGACERCQADVQAESDRMIAGEAAYDLICSGDFVVWDSETTDLDGFFVEVAAVDPYGRTLFDERIAPQVLIEPGAFDVHGIADVDLVGCPTFWDVSEALRRVLHRQRWVIYNVEFDRAVLRREMNRPDCGSYFDRYPIRPKDTFCAMENYATWYGEYHSYWGSYTWQKLDAAADRFGVDVDLPAHSALGDCLRTLGVLYGIAEWYREEISK